MIISRHISRNIADEDLIVIRALNSITPGQAGTITRSVQSIASDWDVQILIDYDGYLSIIATRDTDSLDEEKSFVISGSKERLELSEMHGDDVMLVGTFSDVADLSGQLQSLIRKR